MGLVQDSPVSTNMISNARMIYNMKLHMVCYNFGSKKVSKSKIHIFTISGHMSLKPAIVRSQNSIETIKGGVTYLVIPRKIGRKSHDRYQGRNHGENVGATAPMVGRICPPLWLE